MNRPLLTLVAIGLMLLEPVSTSTAAGVTATNVNAAQTSLVATQATVARRERNTRAERKQRIRQQKRRKASENRRKKIQKTAQTTQKTAQRPPPTTASATQASAIPLPTSSTGCGDTLRKSDGTPWTCTFFDNFNGDALDPEKWSVQETANSGYHEGRECFVDDPRTVSVADGVLDLSSVRISEPVTCAGLAQGTTNVLSGMVTSNGRFSQAYGRFEFRAKFPASTVAGLHSALWLWPQDFTYARGLGEIDVAEFYTAFSNRVVPFLHYDSNPSNTNITNTNCFVAHAGSRFHTYTLEWTPRAMTISFDGIACIRDAGWITEGVDPFDQPYLISLTQALGIGNNASSGDTPLPATMKVDYVRVWR